MSSLPQVLGNRPSTMEYPKAPRDLTRLWASGLLFFYTCYMLCYPLRLCMFRSRVFDILSINGSVSLPLSLSRCVRCISVRFFQFIADVFRRPTAKTYYRPRGCRSDTTAPRNHRNHAVDTSDTYPRAPCGASTAEPVFFGR